MVKEVVDNIIKDGVFMFSADKPIIAQKNDKLKRSVFSQQLAQAIWSYTEKDIFTISLCGKWGSASHKIL